MLVCYNSMLSDPLTLLHFIPQAAAAAAKSLQSCPTLWDPRDGSAPGSPVPGILQARTLEWVAISFSMHESEKWKWSRSVVSDSSRPHGLQPTRLLRPWDFPGKSTGVGCHRLLHFIIWGWCKRVKGHLRQIQLNWVPKLHSTVCNLTNMFLGVTFGQVLFSVPYTYSISQSSVDPGTTYPHFTDDSMEAQEGCPASNWHHQSSCSQPPLWTKSFF